MKTIFLFFSVILTILPFSIQTLAQSEYRIVILGDSLTDGYGLSKEQAFPAIVEKMFHEDGKKNVKIINAGISGSTSSSAKQRLNWFLKSKPQMLAVALGANDGLRGLPIENLIQNLSETVESAQKAGIRVVLFGMKMPPNYGPKYQKDFEQAFVKVAQKYKIERLDFLLDGVATVKELNLEDRIHPNEKGHQVIAKNVYSFLKKLVP